MTALQTALDRLGWSREYAGRRLGLSHETMRQMANGTNSRGNPRSTPPAVLAWVEACANAVDAVPVPKR